jgi:hypothetical protein
LTSDEMQSGSTGTDPGPLNIVGRLWIWIDGPPFTEGAGTEGANTEGASTEGCQYRGVPVPRGASTEGAGTPGTEEVLRVVGFSVGAPLDQGAEARGGVGLQRR